MSDDKDAIAQDVAMVTIRPETQAEIARIMAAARDRPSSILTAEEADAIWTGRPPPPRWVGDPRDPRMNAVQPEATPPTATEAVDPRLLKLEAEVASARREATELREAVAEVARRAALPVNSTVTGLTAQESVEVAGAINKCVRLAIEHVTEPLRAALAGGATTPGLTHSHD